MLDCGGALSKAFNADSVKLATIPMDKPYKGKYTQCLGVYLYKAAHTPVYLKVLLAPDAQKEAGKYVDLLAKNVRYGNSKKEVQFERDKENGICLRNKLLLLKTKLMERLTLISTICRQRCGRIRNMRQKTKNLC